MEQESKQYQEQIELAKFHEERGKEKCACYACAQSKEEEFFVKDKIDRVEQAKSDCSGCYQYKKVDAETGLCKSCSKDS